MNRWTIVLTCLVSVVAAETGLCAADVQPAQSRCEYRENPLGIDAEAPRLSWIVTPTGSGRRGLGQTAYQILVAGTRQQLDQDRGAYDSIRGTVAVDWQLDGDMLTLKVTVPANTSAAVYVPTSDATKVLESGKPAAEATSVTPLGTSDSAAVYRVESGEYVFTAPWE